jgi:hypothetical protein
LAALVDDADVTPLIDAQLVDQVRFAPQSNTAFTTIDSYRSLRISKSDRAQLHRRLAAAREGVPRPTRMPPDRRAWRRPAIFAPLSLAHACRDLVDLAQHPAARSSWNRHSQSPIDCPTTYPIA